jgi:group I intron endonuclease
MLIYRALNKINGKSYIGKTEKTLEIRKGWHLSSVRQNSKYAFHKALVKHGYESFEWQILDNATDLQELNNKEKHYISLYESFGPNGYNMTAGGEGQTGWNPSIETRILWSQQRKGKIPWNKGNNKSMYIPIPPEEKSRRKKIADQKRSQSLKGRKPWNAGMTEAYSRTIYKVIYKDGKEAMGTRLDLGLPKSTIDTMFRDHCGSRKYNIMRIERI